MLANAIIIAAVIAIVILGIRRIVGTATGTRDCCSGVRRGGHTGQGPGREPLPVRDGPTDLGYELRELRHTCRAGP